MDRESTFKRSRHPLVPVAVALAVGIVVDRWTGPAYENWLLLVGVFALAWAIAARRRAYTWSTAFVLVMVIGLGGARHHLAWSVRAANDIANFTDDKPLPVRLVAVLADQPEVVAAPGRSERAAWMQLDSTVASLECREIECRGPKIPVCGRAAFRVTGHLLHVNVGDEVEIHGWLVRLQPAQNPGAFNPADHYRRQGAHCLVTADHPDAVVRRHTGSANSLFRWAARLRAEGETLLARDLGVRTAPVGAALLFGSRTQMDEEIRDAFTQSGMLHILAISGMHVAILAVLLVAAGRALGLSVRATAVVTILGVVGYTLLTDCRPPVVRATILVCLIAGFRFWSRRPAYPNALAIAAIGILLWNPSELFDVGTQLSFLAVLGILWAPHLKRQVLGPKSVEDVLARDIDRGPIQTSARALGRIVLDGYIYSVAVACFTMPLIAARFHLVSPVGLLINVVMSPLSTVVLWAGYIHVAVGFVAPWLSFVPGFFFDRGLAFFVWLVEVSAHVKLSHFFVPGPPDWWLAGFYGLLFALAFVERLRRSGSRGWSMLAAWSIVGLLMGLRSPAPDGLRCTFLSVGHGGAILVETPSGRTLVYDAGAIHDERLPQRVVQAALWEHRQGRIDAMIASHADVDHFNGMTGLMRTLPVGELLVSQQFLDFDQPAVASVCESASASGVPIRLIRDGDRIRLDDQVEFTVLHPSFGRPHSDDNANSVVLLIEFANRRILLTGDLEGAGQRALLELPPCNVDILLSPHHGGAKANVPALAAWANPKQVVVSAGARVDLKRLTAIYGPKTEIVSTHDVGAVTFEIRPDGTIHQSTMRH